jgi:translation initiation factor RLI1
MNDFTTRQEVKSFLDDNITKIVIFEEHIGIMDFIKECIDVLYANGKTYGWEYETARDKFLDEKFNS